MFVCLYVCVGARRDVIVVIHNSLLRRPATVARIVALFMNCRRTLFYIIRSGFRVCWCLSTRLLLNVHAYMCGLLHVPSTTRYNTNTHTIVGEQIFILHRTCEQCATFSRTCTRALACCCMSSTRAAVVMSKRFAQLHRHFNVMLISR